jgi:hypothetical protein
MHSVITEAKKLIILVLISSLLCAGTSTPVSAKDAMSMPSNNSSSATHVEMTIRPSGKPVSGKKVTLNFTVHDMNGHFSAANCLCRVSIQRDGKFLVDSVTPLNTGSSISLNYTFPSGGVFTIAISGMPKDGNAFHPFATTYTQEVRSSTNYLLEIIAIMCLSVAFILIVLVVLRHSYKTYRKPKD